MRVLYAAKSAAGSPSVKAKRSNFNSNPKSKRATTRPPEHSNPARSPPFDYKSTELQCPHFQECSGCTLDRALVSPPLFHRAAAFFSELDYPDFQLRFGPLHGWRHRARLAVRTGPDGQPAVGLFKAGSHHVVDIPKCIVHHPALNAAAELVRKSILACGTQPYNEVTGSGQLRYVQLALVEESSAMPDNSSYYLESVYSEGGNYDLEELLPAIYSVQIVLVWNSEDVDSSHGLFELAAELWRRRKQRGAAEHAGRAGQRETQVHSIHANFQPLRNNVILGPNTVLLHGTADAWAVLSLNRAAITCNMTTTSFDNDSSNHIGINAKNTTTRSSSIPENTSIYNNSCTDVRIAFDPGSFMQANPGTMTHAIESIAQWVPPRSRVVDLHAGVGTIGLTLAAVQAVQSLKAIEINPSAEKSFWRSWEKMKSHREQCAETFSCSSLPENVEYYVAAAGSEPRKWLDNADVAIVDPPRKGLERELLDYLTCGQDNEDLESCTAQPLPKRLIYLSCGFPAFERDCRILLAKGIWQLRFAEAFLFFPGADHIETLAIFDRKD